MPSRRRSVAVEIPWSTIAKVVLTVALVWIWFRVAQLFLLLVLAVLLAVALDPVVQRIERRGWPRWAGATVVLLAVLIAVVGLVTLAVTRLPAQGRLVADRMIEAERVMVDRIPPALRAVMSAGGSGPTAQSVIGPALLRLTQAAADAAIILALSLILTLYLLIEGRRTYRWLLAFVPVAYREKVAETSLEWKRVVFGYVAGNVATSVFATLFALVTLSVLHVPAALLLGLLAGICDFIPVLGFILSAIPAVVLALAVSPVVAASVLSLYVTYHGVENYFIGPWVYGDRLRLSNLAVILAFAVGTSVAGIVGALIALPIAAAYPAIERIWLAERLGTRVVREHASLEGQRLKG